MSALRTRGNLASGSGNCLRQTSRTSDLNVFTTPWSATVTYRRPLGGWLEYVCAENTRESGQRVRQLPQADKPDFRSQRLHDAMVGDRNLSTPLGRMAGICLR